jgi:hypothetical protein
VSYQDVADMAEDWGLRMRLIACAAQEHHEDPVQFVEEHIWRLAGQPGWAQAWAKARAAHTSEGDYEAGKDPKVISDEMILTAMRKVVGHVVARADAEEAKVAARQAAQRAAEQAHHLDTVRRQHEIDRQYIEPLDKVGPLPRLRPDGSHPADPKPEPPAPPKARPAPKTKESVT